MNGEQFWIKVDQALAAVGQRRPWLAEKSGVPLGRINNWHVRKILPRVDDAAKIAAALDTTPQALTGIKDEPPAPALNAFGTELFEKFLELNEIDRAVMVAIVRAVWELYKSGIMQVRFEEVQQALERVRENQPSESRRPSAQRRGVYTRG